MIEFGEVMRKPQQDKLVSELNKFDGYKISLRFRKLIANSRVWFGSIVGATPEEVEVKLSVLGGNSKDENRYIQFPESLTYTASLASKKILNSGTILLDGLTKSNLDKRGREQNHNFSPNDKFIEKVDIEDLVNFSRVSRHPTPKSQYENEFSVLQPENGQIVTFDSPNAAPSLPEGTVRLLFRYSIN